MHSNRLNSGMPTPPSYFATVQQMLALHHRVASVDVQVPLLDGCVVADMVVVLVDGQTLVVELGQAETVFLGPRSTDWTPPTLLQRAALAAEGYAVVVPMQAEQVLTWDSMEKYLECILTAIDNA